MDGMHLACYKRSSHTDSLSGGATGYAGYAEACIPTCEVGYASHSAYPHFISWRRLCSL